MMPDEEDDEKEGLDPADFRWESRVEKGEDDELNKNWKKWGEEELAGKLKKRFGKGDGRDELVDEFRKKLPEITELSARIMSRLTKMSPTMRAHYQGEFYAMAKDLVKDIGLDIEWINIEEDEELALCIMCLLQFPDDDDDDEEEKPDLPKVGDLVNA